MEPTLALNMAEASLRALLREVLGEEWHTVQGAPKLDILAGRRIAAESSHPGRSVSRDPLDYTYIKELLAIYRQEHKRFSSVFNDKSTFETLFQLLANYRNTPSHANQLMPFEADLVSGAAGYITNHITRWRNERDNEESHYPRIISIHDSWGNELTVNGYLFDVASYRFLGDKFGPKVNVGDIITFTCVGSDPRQRDLHWYLNAGPSSWSYSRKKEEPDGTGENARIEWLVTERDVRTQTKVFISLISSSKYHRRGDHDDERGISYFVRPPLDD